MIRKYLAIVSLFIVSIINAQIIYNYDVSDGLISNYVSCIDVDIYDNVWLGTSDGVQMFDGYDWILYNTTLNPGMVSDNIKTITCFSDGSVWAGTDYGVSVFSSQTNDWVTFNSANGLLSNQVRSVNEGPDVNGVVGSWVGTNQGVSFYNGLSWVSYSSPDLHWSGVNETSFDSNGGIWFSSPLGGVTHFDGINNFTTYDTSDGLILQNVTALLIDDQDQKWIGTEAGMSVLDPLNMLFTHHTKMYLLPPPDTLNPVVDIEIDGLDRVWAAIYVGYLTEGGVACWDGSSWIDFDVTDGLIGSNIKDISIDSENNVWVATTNGVSKISMSLNAIDNVHGKHLLCYPNPTRSYVDIHLPNNHGYIYVYDLQGRLLNKYIVSDFNLVIDLDNYQKGSYYVVFDSFNNRYFSSFLVY